MGKREIFLLRKDLASRRQPDHDTDHAKLVGFIAAGDFPYQGSKSGCYFELLKQPEFRHPSRGRAARPAGDFLYHIVGFDKFLQELSFQTDLPGGDPTATPDKFWEPFKARNLNPAEQWVPLASIVTGSYGRDEVPEENPKRRLLYWWTDLPLLEGALIRQMRRIGLPKLWIQDHCIILRCKLAPEIKSAAHIPSVLDGFASEIFLPVTYDSDPASGEAIDLAAHPLQPGAREFVLGPVDVQYLEMRSASYLKEENDALPADAEDPAFQAVLEDFYRSFL